MAFMLAVALACGSPAPTAAPEATAVPSTAEAAAPGDQLVTFTDQSKYFSIEVPGDWVYSQESDTTNNYWYWDKFLSPDGHARVESVVFDDGTAWTGSSSGKQALYMLHEFYSSTGQEGDIRISSDSMQKDGSERLTWTSKGGKFSGISFFEVRNKTAFLMFTTLSDDAYADQYEQLLDDVITSYK
jgi:hypothetical protein